MCVCVCKYDILPTSKRSREMKPWSMQYGIIRFLFQVRMNWEVVAGRTSDAKQTVVRDDGDRGTSDPNELTSSWIISVDASTSLTCFELTVGGMAWHHSVPRCLVASMPLALWLSLGLVNTVTCVMCLPPASHTDWPVLSWTKVHQMVIVVCI